MDTICNCPCSTDYNIKTCYSISESVQSTVHIPSLLCFCEIFYLEIVCLEIFYLEIFCLEIFCVEIFYLEIFLLYLFLLIKHNSNGFAICSDLYRTTHYSVQNSIKTYICMMDTDLMTIYRLLSLGVTGIIIGKQFSIRS